MLVEEMPKYVRSAFISHEDLFAGKWESHLDKLLAQPKPKKKPETNGADVAADMLLESARQAAKKPRGRPRTKVRGFRSSLNRLPATRSAESSPSRSKRATGPPAGEIAENEIQSEPDMDGQRRDRALQPRRQPDSCCGSD